MLEYIYLSISERSSHIYMEVVVYISNTHVLYVYICVLELYIGG